MNKIINKKAGHDYNIVEIYQAGIVLTGNEVKSIKRFGTPGMHVFNKFIYELKP